LAQKPEHNRTLLWFKKETFRLIFFLNKEDIRCSCQASTCKVDVLRDSEAHIGVYPLMLL